MITPPSPCTGSTITQHSPGCAASTRSSAAASPYGRWVTAGSSGRNGSWYTAFAVTDSAPSVLP